MYTQIMLVIKDMENLVVLKKSDLEQLFKEAAEKVINAKQASRKENLDIDEAMEYLSSLGVQVPKSTLYKHTMNGTIPFYRFGERKLMFKADELEEWASDQLSGKSQIEYRSKNRTYR